MARAGSGTASTASRRPSTAVRPGSSARRAGRAVSGMGPRVGDARHPGRSGDRGVGRSAYRRRAAGSRLRRESDFVQMNAAHPSLREHGPRVSTVASYGSSHAGPHGPDAPRPTPPDAQGRHPRGPLVPVQVEVPRQGDAHRPAPARAARQAHRPRRVRVRQPVVGGVRHRGDPPHPARGRRRRAHRLRLRAAHHHRHDRGAGHPDHQLPPDHQGLPVGRRRLHRHQGQPRRAARPGRRRVAAHRLHPRRGRVVLGRRGRPLLARPLRLPLPGADRPALHRHHRLRQPAGREGVGPHLRRADLRLRGRHVPDDRLRHLPGDHRRRAQPRRPQPRADRGGERHRRRRVHPPAAGLRLRWRRRHRRRGHLQRRARLQGAVLEERQPDARDHGRHARRHVPRASRGWPPSSRPSPCQGETVIAQIAQGVYGDERVRHGDVRLHPDRHHAHPGAGRQHRLRRLPPPGQLPGRGQLHAPPAHQAGPPPGVLQRHHRPRRRRRRARGHPRAPTSPS